MKSVAHLPWRMLTYKFINTFIDDLFAFVIRMPTMYRLGCFRDDIIFLVSAAQVTVIALQVYIYQRWIYRVDPKRVNEYGTSMEDPTGAASLTEEEKKAIEEEKEKENKDEAGSSTTSKNEQKKEATPSKKPANEESKKDK